MCSHWRTALLTSTQMVVLVLWHSCMTRERDNSNQGLALFQGNLLSADGCQANKDKHAGKLLD